MCGFYGVFSKQCSAKDLADAVQKNLREIAHRGPDDSNLKTFGQTCMCHLRLSILDLSDSASQAMASDDGLKAISYNGEI